MMDIVKSKQISIWKQRKIVWAFAGACAIAISTSLIFGLGNAAPVASRADLWMDTAQQGEMKREIRQTYCQHII